MPTSYVAVTAFLPAGCRTRSDSARNLLPVVVWSDENDAPALVAEHIVRLVIGVGEEDGHVAVRQAVDEVGADAEDLFANRVGLAEAALRGARRRTRPPGSRAGLGESDTVRSG